MTTTIVAWAKILCFPLFLIECSNVRNVCYCYPFYSYYYRLVLDSSNSQRKIDHYFNDSNIEPFVKNGLTLDIKLLVQNCCYFLRDDREGKITMQTNNKNVKKIDDDAWLYIVKLFHIMIYFHKLVVIVVAAASCRASLLSRLASYISSKRFLLETHTKLDSSQSVAHKMLSSDIPDCRCIRFILKNIFTFTYITLFLALILTCIIMTIVCLAFTFFAMLHIHTSLQINTFSALYKSAFSVEIAFHSFKFTTVFTNYYDRTRVEQKNTTAKTNN